MGENRSRENTKIKKARKRKRDAEKEVEFEIAIRKRTEMERRKTTKMALPFIVDWGLNDQEGSADDLQKLSRTNSGKPERCLTVFGL